MNPAVNPEKFPVRDGNCRVIRAIISRVTYQRSCTRCSCTVLMSRKGFCFLSGYRYSEKTQEEQSNHSRQYRLKHARKASRLDTITNHLKYLLKTSDPLITNIIAKDLHRRRRRRCSASADPTRQTADITLLLRDGAATTDDSPSGEDEKPVVWISCPSLGVEGMGSVLNSWPEDSLLS